MGRIIVVDGTSNAGKTTLCDNLVHNMENIVVVPGASSYARIHNERYPNIPLIPKSAEEEMLNQSFFFKLELDRLIEANRLAKSNNDVFMDRGILEILSVAYSFESINNWNGIYSNAEKLYDRFIAIIKEQNIRLPDLYLWLQASPEEVIKRNTIRQMERGQKLSENDWVNEKLISKQIEFFKKISTRQDKVYLIDTNNKSKLDVSESVCQLLNLQRKEREI